MTDEVFDVLVVGAGPAGMAAAAAAAENRSLLVGLVDAAETVGGQYWRQRATPVPRADASSSINADPLYDQLIARHQSTDVVYLLRHQIWTCARTPVGFALHAVVAGSPERPVTLNCRRLIIATGAFDRQIPFRGWDLPGVVTAGAAQALLKGSGTLIGRRIAIAGTGPFLLPVASGLARAGATVIGVFEHAQLRRWWRHSVPTMRLPGKTGEAARYAATLLQHRIPYRTGWRVTAAYGRDRIESISVSKIGSQRESADITVDALAVGWGFTPQLELARALGCAFVTGADGSRVCAVGANQETSVHGVFAAGEVCGVGGAELARLEGHLAGLTTTGSVTDSRDHRRLLRAIGKHRAFAKAMHSVHALPPPVSWPLDRDTLICRCEEVTYGALTDAVDEHDIRGSRAAKLTTRAGLGWCQGRLCGLTVDQLTGSGCDPSAESYTPSPIASPTRLGTVARDTRDQPKESSQWLRGG